MYDGSFLFFVQDGVVNGNYTGTITDPLMLEGKTPLTTRVLRAVIRNRREPR